MTTTAHRAVGALLSGVLLSGGLALAAPAASAAPPAPASVSAPQEGCSTQKAALEKATKKVKRLKPPRNEARERYYRAKARWEDNPTNRNRERMEARGRELSVAQGRLSEAQDRKRKARAELRACRNA